MKRVECPQWSACGVAGGGCCAAGKFGGKPSISLCTTVCGLGTLVETADGLGDSVAKIAKTIGADRVAKAFEKVTGKPCGCDKRRELLNRLVPYRNKET